jgi:hypothetical protein
VAGDRSKRSSFTDPIELGDVDRNWEEPDPSVFERVTAVPGEIPDAPPDGVGGGEDEPISGLQQRQTPENAMPSFREPLPDDDLPPVLAPAASSKSREMSAKPAAPATSAPPDATWKSTGARKSLPTKKPVLELELDDIPSERPPPEALPDALEAPIKTRSSVPSSLEVSREVLDMRDRYRAGDFTGALVVAEALLEANPAHAEARRCHELCVGVLSQMYLARLGSPTQVVRVAVPSDQIRWLSLDHRAGFLLSLIDGHSTIEELLDISSMPRLDALRILYGLLDQRAIALSER